VRKFDQDFEELQKQSGLSAAASLKYAITRIKEIIAALPECEESEGASPKLIEETSIA
jgi:hypothetical protein